MFPTGFYQYEEWNLANARKPKRATLPARPGPKELRAELREFLDGCVIPALVEKYIAERHPKR
jgi:hypothetical protein